MAHGTQDYDVSAGAATVFKLTDLGELAARIGFINTYDRRGDLVWMDDFQVGQAKWAVVASGTGALAGSTAAYPRNGTNSMILKAGSDGGHSADMNHSQPPLVPGRVGLELSFAVVQAPQFFTVSLIRWDGTKQYNANMQYEGDNHRLTWQQNVGGQGILDANVVLPVGATPQYNTLKMVVNFATGNWERIRFNERSYNMQNVPVRQFADASTPTMLIDCFVTGHLAVTDSVYVDDVILTQNEPAGGA